MRKWEEIFPETDRVLALKTKPGVRQSYGVKPAFLIIDVTRTFVGSKPMPILEAIKEYRTSCGEAGWKAISNIKKLLESCRKKHVPAIFTVNDPVALQFCVGAVKGSGLAKTVDPLLCAIPEPIAPLASEPVIRKTKANVFWGTPLLSCLKSMDVDTLLIAGGTTSGCLRASVVEAFSQGFRCFVVEECTFDRLELSHLVNLFDMDAKYADVITLDEALKYIAKFE